jgi:hypothetical protein
MSVGGKSAQLRQWPSHDGGLSPQSTPTWVGAVCLSAHAGQTAQVKTGESGERIASWDWAGLQRRNTCASGVTEDLPIDDIDRPTPRYEPMRAWSEDLASARTLDALPDAARKYVERIERDAACPIVLVSVGSRRDETIVLEDPFAA